MTIEERVAHLANMTFVMDFHEKLGTIKNAYLLREFNRQHQELVADLDKKEKDLETRKS